MTRLIAALTIGDIQLSAPNPAPWPSVDDYAFEFELPAGMAGMTEDEVQTILSASFSEALFRSLVWGDVRLRPRKDGFLQYTGRATYHDIATASHGNTAQFAAPKARKPDRSKLTDRWGRLK